MNKSFKAHLSTHLFIQPYLDELGVGNSKSITMVPPPARAAARWIPSEVGVAKMNVDGVLANSTNRGDVEVVCHDAQGCSLVHLW